MRKITPQDIISPVKSMILTSNFELDQGTLAELKLAKESESSDMGDYVLGEILNNAALAKNKKMPLCQDTGVSVFFVKWGNECLMEESTIQDVLDEAVREAYQEGFLRKSMVSEPVFDRVNTGDNTPAILHLEMVRGDQIEIQFLAKGSGADNCSQITMLRPVDGHQGVIDFVLKVCQEAGASSCPPWIIGIGIGGSYDTVAGIAKEALLRDIKSKNSDPKYAELEENIFQQLNTSGIGPQGLGGKTSALACLIETKPCHSSSLPVAVNIQCHSNRKGKITV